MNYTDYINLGFTRVECEDRVLEDQTGYSGYVLTRYINTIITIQASYPNLDKPYLYIKKRGAETYHIIQISPEIVRDMINVMVYADGMV